MILWLCFWMIPILAILAIWLALPLFRIPPTACNGPRGVRGTIHWFDLPWLKPVYSLKIAEQEIKNPPRRLMNIGPGGVQWWASFDPYDTPIVTATANNHSTANPAILIDPAPIAPGKIKPASSPPEPCTPD